MASDDINNRREALQSELKITQQLVELAQTHKALSKSGTDLKADLIDQLKSQSDISSKINAIDSSINDLLLEQVQRGSMVNQHYIDQLANLKDIAAKRYEQVEINKEISDIQSRMNDKLYDGLGLLGSWLRVGTSIEMASMALEQTVAAIGSGFDNVFGQVVSLNRELGVSVEQAGRLNTTAIAAGLSLGGLRFSTDELNSATAAYVETLGTAGHLSAGLTRNIADLTKLTGDAEGAVTLSSIFEHAAHDSEHLTHNIKELAEKEGVAASRIFRDLVGQSNLLVGASEEQIENIVQQNIELQKQGLSMEKLNSISDNVLDIESSLRAQAKARALLSGTITDQQFAAMNAIRQQAILYEQGVQTQEEFGKAIQGSLITVEEFNQLGRRGQMVYADAIGMTVDQIQQMYETQAAVQEQITPSWVDSTIGHMARIWESTPGFIKQALTSLIGYVTQMSILSAMQGGPGLFAGLKNLAGSLNPFSGGGIGKATKGVQSAVGGISGSFGKINTGAILKGAAAMVLVAGSLWVFGEAVQQFTEVGWEDVGKAVVSMFALVGAVVALGAIMTSGVGTVAILAGAAAMVVIAGAVWLLGEALNNMLPAMQGFGDILSPIAMLAPGLLAVSAALTSLGMAGIVALPGVAAITALAAVAPALSGLGESLGLAKADSDKTENVNDNSELIEEIRGLRADIQTQPIVLNIDGKAVSKITRVQGRQGVNERSFK